MKNEECYKMGKMECLEFLNSSERGLSEREIELRSVEAKKYQIRPEQKKSFLRRFLSQIKELMVLVLLVSGLISIGIGIAEHSSGEIIDGAIILGIVVVNACFGVYQERKSESAIERLKKMTKPQTLARRDGKVLKINSADLVVGDIVCLDAGSIAPVDLRLIESTCLSVNESALTGESLPVRKDCEVVYEKDVAFSDRKNCVFCGSVIESGNSVGVVTAVGTQTQLGKIAESLRETKKELTPLQKNIQSVGKILTYLILLIASITFVLEVISNPNEILQAFLTAVAISVAAIPESLPAVITIIMSLGVGKLSKQRAIVKHLHSVETLGACDVICSDKTGTITQNKMKVKETFCLFDEKSNFENQFFYGITLCNDAKFGESGYVGSATEVALLNYAKSNHFSKEELDTKCKRLQEEPFSSKRKMMVTINSVCMHSTCYAKGALDRILKRCKFYAYKNQTLSLDKKIEREILEKNRQMCKNGLRVIAVAFKIDCDTLQSDELTFLGLCGIQDPPRKEVKDAVSNCMAAGIRPVMITGDFQDTAFAIAKQVGIALDESQVVNGEELDKADEKSLKEIVESKSVFARVSPENKVEIVSALQKNGHTVGMTGDGVNDAPSMKKADIGVGMGRSGTDVAKDVADILITDDNFSTIVSAVKEGRKIYSNIQKTITYLFSANMAEILALFFITIFLPGKIFLLPVQILFVNLITDSLPAIALGVEPVEKDIMKEKPRRKNLHLLSGGVGVKILVLGAVQTLLTLGAYLFGLFLHGQMTAITMGFYTLNLIQLFYMFTARTNENCFKSNPFKNKFFNLSLLFGFGLVLLMALTSFGGVLKLENLNSVCWLVVVCLSVSIVFVGEAYKMIERLLKKKKLH